MSENNETNDEPGFCPFCGSNAVITMDKKEHWQLDCMVCTRTSYIEE